MIARKNKSVAVAISLDDGRLAIMRFHTDGTGPGLVYGSHWVDEKNGHWEREATPANVDQEIARTNFHGANAVGYRILSEAEASIPELGERPENRLFRDALKDNKTAVEHDIDKARNVHLSRVRAARGPVLDQLDRDWQRAKGQGDKRACEAIEAKRQELRDLPTTLGVEGATTVEELKAMWPPSVPLPKYLRHSYKRFVK